MLRSHACSNVPFQKGALFINRCRLKSRVISISRIFSTESIIRHSVKRLKFIFRVTLISNVFSLSMISILLFAHWIMVRQ